MNLILKIIICTALSLVLFIPSGLANVQILCYHEVDGRPNDVFSVSSANLESHIQYLKQSGYRFISLDEYLSYTRDELKLPEKSVMLTFDDGYLSFYTKAYPLLQKYQVPAMLAIVSSWSNEVKPSDVGTLLEWDHLIEMEQSGLVTLASHSYALHKQQPINPQGTLGSIAKNRLYFNGRYESEEEYERRLNNDFEAVQHVFKEKLGRPIKAFVWPYGAYSGKSVKRAVENGFEATFLLSGGSNLTGEAARIYAKRGLIYGNPNVAGLKKVLATDLDAWNGLKMRMAQVDIDAIYSEDPKELEKNIAALKERLYKNQVKVVALQAFADPDGDGNVDGVYFYNWQVPVVADVFNYITNSLQMDRYRVVAWMPSLTLQALARSDGSNLIAANPPQNLGWYKRVTPFDPMVKEKLKALYSDLAEFTPVEGVLFQDDLYLNDFEDYSVYGQAAYAERFHKPLSRLDRNNQQEMDEWTDFKTECLNELVDALTKAFKANCPEGTVMRNVYTGPVLYPESKEWFAQNLEQYLDTYDYTIVMAYPFMDKAKDLQAYLRSIVNAVKAHPGAIDKMFFKIQSYDWDKEKWIDEAELNRQVKTLEDAGAVNIGYYPDTPMVVQPMRKKAIEK